MPENGERGGDMGDDHDNSMRPDSLSSFDIPPFHELAMYDGVRWTAELWRATHDDNDPDVEELEEEVERELGPDGPENGDTPGAAPPEQPKPGGSGDSGAQALGEPSEPHRVVGHPDSPDSATDQDSPSSGPAASSARATAVSPDAPPRTSLKEQWGSLRDIVSNITHGEDPFSPRANPNQPLAENLPPPPTAAAPASTPDRTASPKPKATSPASDASDSTVYANLQRTADYERSLGLMDRLGAQHLHGRSAHSAEPPGSRRQHNRDRDTLDTESVAEAGPDVPPPRSSPPSRERSQRSSAARDFRPGAGRSGGRTLRRGGGRRK